MPYAKVPLDNGESIQFYVPQGISPEQATSIAPTMWQYQQQGIDIMAPPPPPEKTIFGFGEKGAGRVGEIPKGIASGGIGLLGLGAEGIATLLADGNNEEAFVDLIRAGTETLQSPFAAKYGYEDSLTRKLSEGLGSTLPFLATGFGGLGALAKGTALAGSAGAGAAAQRARDAGATQEQINQAALRGLPVGLSEIAMPFGAAKVVKALRTQAKAGEEVAQTALKRLGRVASAGTGEGAQEAAAEIAQNMIAQDLYDPETGTFAGTGESFGIGAGVGGIIQGLLELAIPGRTRTPPSVSVDDTSTETETPEGGTPPVASPTEQQDLFDDLPAGAAPTSSVQEQQDALFALIDTPSAEELQQQYPAAFSIPLEELQKERTTLESLNIPDEATYDAIVAARTQPATSDAAQGTLDLTPAEQPADEPQSKGKGSAIRLDDDGNVIRVDGTEVGESLTAGAEVLNKGQGSLDLETTDTTTDEGKTVRRASIFGQQPIIKKDDTDAGMSLTDGRERISVIEDAARQDESVDVSEEVGEDQTVIDQREAAKKRDEEARKRKEAAIKAEEAVDPKSLEEDPQTNLYEEFNEEAKRGEEKFGKWRSNIDTEALPIAEEDINNSLIVGYQNSKPPKISKDTGRFEVAKSPTPEQGARAYFRNYKNPASAIRAIAGDVALDRKTKIRSKGVFSRKQIETMGATARLKHAKAAEKFIRDNLSAPTIEALDAQIEDAARQYQSAESKKRRVTPQTKKETIAARKKLEAAKKDTDKQLTEADKKEEKETKAGKMSRISKAIQKGNFQEAVLLGAKSSDPTVSLSNIGKKQQGRVWDQLLNNNPETTDILDLENLDEVNNEEIDEIVGVLGGSELALPKNAVIASTLEVATPVKNAIKAGDIKKVYELLSESSNPLIARMAKAIAENIGTTKIRFGKQQGLAGYFDPTNNTITIDPDADVNSHVLLHEAGHAITSHVIATEPSNPAVRQLKKAYEYAKSELTSAYGSESLDEFVAEAQSNPRFRSELNLLPYKSTKGRMVTVWEAVKRAFQNILNRILKRPLVEKPTNTSNIDQLIEAIISPAPASRAAPILAMDVNAQLRQLGAQSRTGYLSKEGYKKSIDVTKKWLKEDATPSAKRKAQTILPLNALADLYTEELPSGWSLFRTIQEKVGSRSKILAEIKDTGASLAKKIKRGTKRADILNDLVIRTTMSKTDPSKDRTTYSDYWAYWEENTGKKRDSGAVIYKAKEKHFTSAEARNDWISKNLDGKQNVRGVQKRNKNVEKLKEWDEFQKLWNSKEFGQEGRDAYIELRDAYGSMYDRLMDTVDDRLQEFDIDSKLRKTISDKIFEKLKNKERIEPYFPLYRHGKHWLTFKLKGDAEPYKMLFDRAVTRQGFVWELENNPEFKNKVDLSTVTTSDQESSYTKSVENMQTGAAFDILQNLKSQKAPKEIQDSIMEIMLDSMPETNVLQMFRSRAEVLGPEADAIGVYNKRMPAFAQQIVNLEYEIPLEKVNRKLAQEADDSKDDNVRAVYKENFQPYIAFANNPNINDITKWTKSLVFGGTLGMNVSSVVANSTNLGTVVYPVLAGKYGVKEASAAMGDATALYFGSPTRRKRVGVGSKELDMDVWDGWNLTNWDFSKNANGKYNDPNLPDKYKHLEVLVEVLERQGQANRSTIGEMTDQENPARGGMQLFNFAMGAMFHQGERANRQITAISSFNLQLDKKLKELKEKGITKLRKKDLYEAAYKAIEEVEFTNSGAMIETAPKVAQSNLGSIALMYKRFGISMYYLQARTAYHALKRANSPEEKRLARNQLYGLFGASALFAGVQGIPMFGAAMALYNVFLDDEEDDAETITARFLGEGMYSGPLNAIFNIDIAPRIGMNNLLYRSRPNELSTLTEKIIEFAGGPAVGVAYGKIIQGGELVADGEVWRGTERMLPAFASGWMKSYRYGTEGARTLRGDPITESIDLRAIIGQFTGFSPASYTKQLELNAVEKRKERNIQERRTKLLDDLYQAEREGDSDGMREVREDMKEFNKRHRNYRITPRTIARSLGQHRRTTREVADTGGVTYSRRNRQSVIRRNFEALGIE